MGDVVCNECGQELSSGVEPHDINDCALHHLKRAINLLGTRYVKGFIDAYITIEDV